MAYSAGIVCLTFAAGLQAAAAQPFPAADDLTPQQIAALEKTEVPPGHERLDAELKDWVP